MNDFDLPSFWNAYVCVIVVLAFVFLFFLVTFVSGKITKESKNDPTHVWDGNLSEYNNPLPKWWRVMFICLLIFGVCYLIYYPGLGNFRGLGHWTELQEYNTEMAQANAQTKTLYDQFDKMQVADLAKQPVAMKMAERLFVNNCSQCHASDAKGQLNFPDLTKHAGWNWGGTPADISATITNGRQAVMPAVQLSSADLGNVTAYVQGLSTTPFEKMNVAQKAGKDVFDAHCAACHQPNGKGMTAMGAPDLTDPIWQYGGSTAAIEQDITHGLNGVMPAANPDILSPSKVHLLTAYIYELSHR